jgi:hypothetical protein
MSFITAPSSPHRQRAEENFKAAALLLQRTIPIDASARIGNIAFPDFDNVDGVEVQAHKLESALETLIQARTELGKKESRRRKVEDVMTSWFRASYPFANIFLSVVKQGSAVLCPLKNSIDPKHISRYLF